MKKIFGILFLTMLTLAVWGVTSSYAIPVLGGQLYSLGGNVQVEVLPASAGFDSELHLFTGGDRFIATNRDTGLIINLGTFTAGEELLFGIYVINTGDNFYMGPGSRNPDGIEHAVLDFIGIGIANVGFEDLFGGGDRDYDDNMFQFRGSVAPNPVPEPSTLLLLGSGLLGLAGLIKKKIKS